MRRIKLILGEIILFLSLFVVGLIVTNTYAEDVEEDKYSDYTEFTSETEFVVNGKYKITSNDSFKAFYAASQNVYIYNYEVILTKDLDFSGDTCAFLDSKGCIRGTFDGNGKTISNLNVYQTNYINSQNIISLFQMVSGTLKNLTIDNLHMYLSTTPNKVDASVIGDVYDASVVEDVTLKNSIIDSSYRQEVKEYAHDTMFGSASFVRDLAGVVKNCLIENSVIIGMRAAGFAYTLRSGAILTHCKANSSKIYGLIIAAGLVYYMDYADDYEDVTYTAPAVTSCLVKNTGVYAFNYGLLRDSDGNLKSEEEHHYYAPYNISEDYYDTTDLGVVNSPSSNLGASVAGLVYSGQGIISNCVYWQSEVYSYMNYSKYCIRAGLGNFSVSGICCSIGAKGVQMYDNIFHGVIQADTVAEESIDTTKGIYKSENTAPETSSYRYYWVSDEVSPKCSFENNYVYDSYYLTCQYGADTGTEATFNDTSIKTAELKDGELKYKQSGSDDYYSVLDEICFDFALHLTPGGNYELTFTPINTGYTDITMGTENKQCIDFSFESLTYTLEDFKKVNNLFVVASCSNSVDDEKNSILEEKTIEVPKIEWSTDGSISGKIYFEALSTKSLYLYYYDLYREDYSGGNEYGGSFKNGSSLSSIFSNGKFELYSVEYRWHNLDDPENNEEVTWQKSRFCVPDTWIGFDSELEQKIKDEGEEVNLNYIQLKKKYEDLGYKMRYYCHTTYSSYDGIPSIGNVRFQDYYIQEQSYLFDIYYSLNDIYFIQYKLEDAEDSYETYFFDEIASTSKVRAYAYTENSPVEDHYSVGAMAKCYGYDDGTGLYSEFVKKYVSLSGTYGSSISAIDEDGSLSFDTMPAYDIEIKIKVSDVPVMSWAVEMKEDSTSLIDKDNGCTLITDFDYDAELTNGAYTYLASTKNYLVDNKVVEDIEDAVVYSNDKAYIDTSLLNDAYIWFLTEYEGKLHQICLGQYVTGGEIKESVSTSLVYVNLQFDEGIDIACNNPSLLFEASTAMPLWFDNVPEGYKVSAASASVDVSKSLKNMLYVNASTTNESISVSLTEDASATNAIYSYSGQNDYEVNGWSDMYRKGMQSSVGTRTALAKDVQISSKFTTPDSTESMKFIGYWYVEKNNYLTSEDKMPANSDVHIYEVWANIATQTFSISATKANGDNLSNSEISIAFVNKKGETIQSDDPNSPGYMSGYSFELTDGSNYSLTINEEYEGNLFVCYTINEVSYLTEISILGMDPFILNLNEVTAPETLEDETGKLKVNVSIVNGSKITTGSSWFYSLLVQHDGSNETKAPDYYPTIQFEGNLGGYEVKYKDSAPVQALIDTKKISIAEEENLEDESIYANNSKYQCIIQNLGNFQADYFTVSFKKYVVSLSLPTGYTLYDSTGTDEENTRIEVTAQTNISETLPDVDKGSVIFAYSNELEKVATFIVTGITYKNAEGATLTLVDSSNKDCDTLSAIMPTTDLILSLEIAGVKVYTPTAIKIDNAEVEGVDENSFRISNIDVSLTKKGDSYYFPEATSGSYNYNIYYKVSDEIEILVTSYNNLDSLSSIEIYTLTVEAAQDGAKSMADQIDGKYFLKGDEPSWSDLEANPGYTYTFSIGEYTYDEDDGNCLQLGAITAPTTLTISVTAKTYTITYQFKAFDSDSDVSTLLLGGNRGYATTDTQEVMYNEEFTFNYHSGMNADEENNGTGPLGKMEILDEDGNEVTITDGRMPACNLTVKIHSAYGSTGASVSIQIKDDKGDTQYVEIRSDNILISTSSTEYIENKDVYITVADNYYYNGVVYNQTKYGDDDYTGSSALISSGPDAMHPTLKKGYLWYKTEDGQMVYLCETARSEADGGTNYHFTLVKLNLSYSTNSTIMYASIGGIEGIESDDTMTFSGYFAVGSTAILQFQMEDNKYEPYVEGAPVDVDTGAKVATMVLTVPSINSSINITTIPRTYYVHFYKDTENVKEEFTEQQAVKYGEKVELSTDYVDGNKRIDYWIYSGSQIDSDFTMGEEDIYVYGHWIECGSFEFDLVISDGENNIQTKNSIVVSSSKTEYIAEEADAFEYADGHYKIAYAPAKTNSTFLWIVLPDGSKEFFGDASTLADKTSYEYVQVHLFGTMTTVTTEDHLWREKSSATVRIKLVFETGYTCVSMTENMELYGDTLVIQKFNLNYDKTYSYDVNMIKYRIFYKNPNGTSWKTEEYYYNSNVLLLEYEIKNYKFTGWVDLTGTPVTSETMPTMPATDITLVATISENKVARFMVSAVFSFNFDSDLFLSSSKEAVVNKTMYSAVDGSYITFEYTGTMYLWAHDNYYDVDKYLGIEVEDGRDIIVADVIVIGHNYATITNAGIRLVEDTSPIKVTCLKGYGFNVITEGYAQSGNYIVIPSVSDTDSTYVEINEYQIEYKLNYYVNEDLVKTSTYYYNDDITDYVSDFAEFEASYPGFNFAQWSIETEESGRVYMPDYDMNIYALQKASYLVQSVPTVSKIHAGEALSTATISGGVITIGAVQIEGTFKFKNGKEKPSVSDSMSTEYEVVFTPKENYEPLIILVTIEVCNPKYDKNNLVAPTVVDKTSTMLTISMNEAYEYSTDGVHYQAGGEVVFADLYAGEEITIRYRYAKDDNYCESDYKEFTEHTKTEDEMLFDSSKEEGLEAVEFFISQRFENDAVREFLSEFDGILSNDYGSEQYTGEEFSVIVEFYSGVLNVISEISDYRTYLDNLNSDRIKAYANGKFDEIIDLATEDTELKMIESFGNFILGVFSACDNLIGSYDVKDSDLNKEETKLSSMTLTNSDSESVYVINKIDELLQYDYVTDDAKYGKVSFESVNINEYKQDFVGNNVTLMKDASAKIHSCTSANTSKVASIVGEKVSAVQALTYMDYKFNRAEYDAQFYIAAEAAIIAHLQGLVLNMIEEEFAAKASALQKSDISKYSLLLRTKEELVEKYSDYEAFREIYLDRIGTDGTVTYQDLLVIFEDEVAKALVVPITANLSEAEIIVIFVFSAAVLGCLVAVIIRSVLKKRGYAYADSGRK